MSYSRLSIVNCEPKSEVNCNVEASLSILGGKWKLKIYKTLRNDTQLRFKDIKALLEPISDKTLSTQLREMEEDGLVIRKVFAEVPPRVEYHLTELGQSLEAIFMALDQWGQQYISQQK
jgi:DNA-binding HxlR family transcriptional regulator